MLSKFLRAATVANNDPNFENVTLLLPGDGTNGAQNNTFIDSSSNNFSITRNGNTTQGTFSPYGTLWSNYFNGSTDYFSINAQTALSFGTGDFTLEAWVYPTSVPSLYAALIEARNTGGTATAVPWIFGLRSSGGVLKPEFYTGTQYTGSTTVPTNTWTHVAFTRSSSTLRAFVNGVLDTSWSSVTTSCNAAATAQWIGRLIDGANSYFPGYISNLRVVKGQALYTANFTPSTIPLTTTSQNATASNVSLLTCQSNRFIDNSSNAFAITANGTPSVQRFNPFIPASPYSTSVIGGSGYFDGSGDYLTAAYNSAFNVGTGDFTLECWVYVTSLPSVNAIGGNHPSINGGGLGIYINSAGNPQGQVWVSGSSTADGVGSAAITRYTWNHIALVRKAGSLTLYTNGVGGGPTASTKNVNNTSAFYVGAYEGTTYIINAAHITDFRFNNTALYSGNFTPPTAPLSNVSGTVLLLNCTNAGIIDNAMMNDLETVGNAQISTSVSKWGGGSIYFDGTGDYLVSNPATSNLYAFGTGDFTIEFWVYLNNTNTAVIFDTRPSATNGVYPMIYVTSSTFRFFVSSADRITSSSVSTATWYHLVICRSGTSTKMFINGNQAGSTYTDSNNYLCGASRPFIGINSTDLSAAFNGYIDDLRITKGYARYTADFSTPGPLPLV